MPVAALGTERHQRRVGPGWCKSLVDAQGLVGAGDHLRGKASVGIAMLDDLIRLQHAKQSHLLAETADVAVLRKHGDRHVRVNPVTLVVSHVAELAADDCKRPADRCLYLDVDRSHRADLLGWHVSRLSRREIAITGPIGYATTDGPILLLATECHARPNERLFALADGRMKNL